jgi:hypothetical protein
LGGLTGDGCVLIAAGGVGGDMKNKTNPVFIAAATSSIHKKVVICQFIMV